MKIACHIATVCGRGSLVKLCGLTWIKFLRSAHLCRPDALRAAGMGTALRCWPGHPRSSPPPVRRRRWYPVIDWSFTRAFQTMVLEIIISVCVYNVCLCVVYIRRLWQALLPGLQPTYSRAYTHRRPAVRLSI